MRVNQLTSCPACPACPEEASSEGGSNVEKSKGQSLWRVYPPALWRGGGFLRGVHRGLSRSFFSNRLQPLGAATCPEYIEKLVTPSCRAEVLTKAEAFRRRRLSLNTYCGSPLLHMSQG
jgi:hypothetical protein